MASRLRDVSRQNGDGKVETAKEMKLTMMDFTDPDTLKDRTDGETCYVIKRTARTNAGRTSTRQKMKKPGIW